MSLRERNCESGSGGSYRLRDQGDLHEVKHLGQVIGSVVVGIVRVEPSILSIP